MSASTRSFSFAGDKKFFLKGVTYGPFHPDAAGEFFGTPDKVRADLALMRDLGVNLLRVYYVPPRWFMDLLAEAGLFVLISIPWAEHVEFLNDRAIRTQVVRTVREAVGTHRGHPAVFGYLVGNEIPTTMVRWLGVRRVTQFLEHLINVARAVDPAALYSYASYPPTEYLLPQNVDFCTFNVYLHAPARLRELPPAPAEPSPTRNRASWASSAWTRSATPRRNNAKCSRGTSRASCAAGWPARCSTRGRTNWFTPAAWTSPTGRSASSRVTAVPKLAFDALKDSMGRRRR